MPLLPMPCTNGHELPTQSGSSISSLDPAIAICEFQGSIATAGSFCLFCGNVDGWLPTDTIESASEAAGNTSAQAHPIATKILPSITTPLVAKPPLHRTSNSAQKGQHRLKLDLRFGELGGRVRI